MQLVLKNAHYYLDNTFLEGDIYIDQGKIALICEPGAQPLPTFSGGRVLDVAGLTVLPGVVDSHVHFREPSANDSEDFFSGSCAAAAGGVTTVCEMPNVLPPVYSPEVLAQRVALSESKSLVDIAFYGAAGFANRKQLQALQNAGVVAFKTFLHPAPSGRESDFYGLTVADDGELLLLMQEAAKLNMRMMFHCENYRVIAQMENYLKEQGVVDNSFHYRSRPDVAEVQSVATVLQFAKATGVRVGICHVSVPDSCALVKEAQAQGIDVIAETCWHYLIFDQSAIDRLGPYAKCNPPLRSRSDVEGLWSYLTDGTISMIGSDHAPHWRANKEKGVVGPIWQAPSGLPSIEVMLPMLLTQVADGRLSLVQLARLLSENTCRNLGLYPRKGCIAVGSDADFTIIDPDDCYMLDKNMMQTNARDVNVLFDGLMVQGRPVFTIVRGEVIMEKGLVHVEKKGWGCYVPRQD